MGGCLGYHYAAIESSGRKGWKERALEWEGMFLMVCVCACVYSVCVCVCVCACVCKPEDNLRYHSSGVVHFVCLIVLNFFLPLCVLVFYLHVCLCEAASSLGSEVTDSCELPCWYWELNSGLLEEQPVLLTAEPSLRPYFVF